MAPFDFSYVDAKPKEVGAIVAYLQGRMTPFSLPALQVKQKGTEGAVHVGKIKIKGGLCPAGPTHPYMLCVQKIMGVM